MPWDLWRACHWAMVPVAGIVAYLLLSIEEIGVQMEVDVQLAQAACGLLLQHHTTGTGCAVRRRAACQFQSLS